MARKKDTELTKTVHLRVSEAMAMFFEQHAKNLNLAKPDLYRLALAMFIRRGGADYKEKD